MGLGNEVLDMTSKAKETKQNKTKSSGTTPNYKASAQQKKSSTK